MVNLPFPVPYFLRRENVAIDLNEVNSEYNAPLLNENFQKIEEELNENALRRGGLDPNEDNRMRVPLDMNSQPIYNLRPPIHNHEPIRLQDLQQAIEGGANHANLIIVDPIPGLEAENVQEALVEIQESSSGVEGRLEGLEEQIEEKADLSDLIPKVDREEVFAPSPLTVNIPSDFPTIQEAIDHYQPFIKEAGQTITINIQSGHALTHGVSVVNGDYSAFEIVSESSVVPLASGFEPATTSPIESAVIYGFNARMPRLSCLINMNNQYEAGCFVDENSSMHVSPDAGVINAGTRGLVCRGSRVWCEHTNWSGANGSGIRAQQASVVSAQGANCNNCMQDSISNTDGAIFASRASTIHFQGGTATGSGVSGLFCQRSYINAQGCNFSNAAGNGVWVQRMGKVNLDNCVIRFCTGNGIRAQDLANISAAGADLRDNGASDVSIGSERGVAIINLTDAQTTNGSPAVEDVVGVTSFNSINPNGIAFASNIV